MKNIFTTLLFTVSTILVAQEMVKIEYQVNEVANLDLIKNSKERDYLRKKNLQVEYIELITSKTESIIKKTERLDNSQSKSFPSDGLEGTVYRDLINNQNMITLEAPGKKFIIQDDIKGLDW